ncbi:MAG: hypothetical protein FWG05_00165 [Kiritimatiellaeota bacterium]|nr:hypothetical protein [Kiritimatiellota bacterium]
MLGFGIRVYRASEPQNDHVRKCLAHWTISSVALPGRKAWEDIEKNSVLLERNGGYPLKYETTGKFVKAFLKDGMPGRIAFFGDESAGYPTTQDPRELDELVNGRCDDQAVAALDDDEKIIIDCWDQS